MKFAAVLLAAVSMILAAVPAQAGDYEDAVALRERGNIVQAQAVFVRLAEHGDARAQGALAGMYGDGQGVAVDLPEAHKWAVLAQANGNADADALRAAIEKRMPPEMLALALERARLQSGKPQSGRRINIRIRPAGSVAAKPGGASAQDAVLQALQAWRSAEAQRDINVYLAAYAPDLNLPRGLPRALWESQRRERMGRTPLNVVKTTDPVVNIAADGSVAVQFTQVFQSRTYRETVDKTLVFGNYGGRWLIRDEIGKRRRPSQGL